MSSLKPQLTVKDVFIVVFAMTLLFLLYNMKKSEGSAENKKEDTNYHSAFPTTEKVASIGFTEFK